MKEFVASDAFIIFFFLVIGLYVILGLAVLAINLTTKPRKNENLNACRAINRPVSR